MHAFTGCDTVSAFAGKGKITAPRLVKQHTSYQELFKQLDMEWVLSDMLFQSLQEFTWKLYCPQPGTDNINELRYRLFYAKKGNQLVLIDKTRQDKIYFTQLGFTGHKRLKLQRKLNTVQLRNKRKKKM